MAVVAVFEGITQKQYEDTCRKLTGGKKARMESASDWPVAGIVAHIAGQSPRGFRVVDVWESEQALQRFAEVLMPILKEVGVTGEPEVYPVLAHVST